jgi:glycolate oxidase FAD binding subunit
MSSLQHFQDQITAARASKSALRIRGGGTKDFYGNALGNHTVLDTRSHSGITSYEPSELVVTVRAGTPLAELEAALLEKNQYLPFEPPHFASGGTVGGMVASGLSGAARAVTGSVRDHILGVQIINGAGDVLNFGGTVMKNVAGYDVSRLLAGSMGTLALMTEVSIKVLPIPVADATLMCHLGQAEALALMHRWRAQPLPINSTAWMHDGASATVSLSATPVTLADYLFVRLRGAKAAVDSALGRIQQDVETAGGSTSQMDSAAAAKDWQTANNHLMPFFVQTPVSSSANEMCLWRLSLPATTPALPVPHPQYIEWQGAQRWLWARANEQHALQVIASAAGGHAVLFKSSQAHGDADKAQGAFQAQSAVLTTINQSLREQLDPHGVFNTRRI